ncbi:MAG: pilin [bacterium]|nr:pilin [bacterium]
MNGYSRTTLISIAITAAIIFPDVFCVSRILPAFTAQAAAPAQQSSAYNSIFDNVSNLQPSSGIKKYNNFAELAVAILKIALAVVAIIATGALVWGGVMYITSLGDDQKSGTAKKVIFYAIIGLLVIGISAVAVNVLITIFLGSGNTPAASSTPSPSVKPYSPEEVANPDIPINNDNDPLKNYDPTKDFPTLK